MVRSKGRGPSAYISRIIEPQMTIQARDGIQFRLIQIKARNLKILLQTLWIITLWNDSKSTLCRPSQQYLSWGLVVLFSEGGYDRMLEENRRVLCFLPFELDERLGSKGGLGCYCNSFALC